MMAAADLSGSGITTAEMGVRYGSDWRIWSVIDELEKNGNGKSSPNIAGSARQDEDGIGREDMTKQVVEIMRMWGELWAGETSMQTLLNKKSLLHEVEESIAALHFLTEWLERRQSHASPPVTLVDVCCGKGILSMLASYLFRNRTSAHVAKIIMLDRQEDINWSHIIASNSCANEEGRPLIESWGGCNLLEIDHIVEKFQRNDGTNNEPLALVGIHLCKQLSPSLAGIANCLGPERAPFLCLAPCCLPRGVRNLIKSNNNFGMAPKRKIRRNAKQMKTSTCIVPVRKYETAEENQARMEAKKLRDGAYRRTFANDPCYICGEIHAVHKCNLLPADENECLVIFEKAAAMTPCWKCGRLGHFKKDCPMEDGPSKPSLPLPPTYDLDVSSALAVNGDTNPWECYVNLLSSAIERENVGVFDVGLVNGAAQHDNAANRDNWNRDRKSMFIIASAM